MKKEFNLEKALNGAKLVTRDGREVTNFRKRIINTSNPYKYLANIDGKPYSFTDKGKFKSYNTNSDLDLFIDKFTISDLKTGMRVKVRNNNYYIVFVLDNKTVLVNNYYSIDINSYDNNFKFKDKFRDGLDIIEVYDKPIDNSQLLNVNILGELLWERNENTDVLDSEDFYNVMQNYRNATIDNQDRVVEYFETVKDWIRNNYK